MARMQGSFEQRGTEVQLCKAQLAMQEQEQVRVIAQRLMSGSRVVKYALAAFRYFVTGIVAMVLALLLVLLIVELGAVIGATLEHDMLASRNYGGSVMCASPQAKAFFEGTSHAEDQFQ
jgi:hypothetical protein